MNFYNYELEGLESNDKFLKKFVFLFALITVSIMNYGVFYSVKLFLSLAGNHPNSDGILIMAIFFTGLILFVDFLLVVMYLKLRSKGLHLKLNRNPLSKTSQQNFSNGSRK